MIKFGLWPDEFEKAIQMDRDYTTNELRTFCREEGLPTGGEKKRLIANLIIKRRNDVGKSEKPGMDSQTRGTIGNPSGVSGRSEMGYHGIVFEKSDNAPMQGV
jgi:hypothetical protein